MTDLAPADRCLDCDGARTIDALTCGRCYGTGRRHYLRFVVEPNGPDYVTLTLYYGAGQTQGKIASSAGPPARMTNMQADLILSAVTDPGIAIDDRRQR